MQKGNRCFQMNGFARNRVTSLEHRIARYLSEGLLVLIEALTILQVPANSVTP